MEDIEKLQIAARAKNRTIETDKINWRLIFTMHWGVYEVYVDGIIGPWFLKPWIQLARAGMDVRYIVLRPDEPTTCLLYTSLPMRSILHYTVASWKCAMPEN